MSNANAAPAAESVQVRSKMSNVNAAAPAAESVQVEAGGGKTEPPPPPAPPSPALHGGSKVYKSGPLFLSSKGIGWTSWKKRWFVLTQTSLVFYRSDPNAGPSKSGEVNLTLGGIDLNSSGSVVVKEDKKLLTVLFTDGRDGRAFTLKAETLEDLYEWRSALEEALLHAPKAATVMGQNGLLKNDQSNAADASSEQSKEKQSPKSLVIGRPVLLALEDIDGTPSFLEKALRFLEGPGVKTEGILRQAADVEDVERRIQEYEKGKNEFSPDEDAHVIADCVKYVLRELPSYPVPASCCKALLEACRTERSMRVAAMRSAICETFPEPNRRLLQRILMMMQTVASNKAVNRMSISAVAACMAPLLLRPLLAGDCDIDHDFDMGGDGSVQLMQAAAAANHAQAIVITLLEEYNNIFGDVAETHEPYTDSEEESGSEEISDYDDESFEEEDEFSEGSEYEEDEEDEEIEHESSQASSDTGENRESEKVSGIHSSGHTSTQADDVLESNQRLSSGPPQTSLLKNDRIEERDNVSNLDNAKMQEDYSEDEPDEAAMAQLTHGASRSMRNKPTVWGRAGAKKNLSMESIDLPHEDEPAIQKLESIKTDLESRISEEAMANSQLQETLGVRKRELHERRLALQEEVGRLQKQLQKEMDLRKALEAALKISQEPISISPLVDEKMKVELEDFVQKEADVANLKKKADEIEVQLSQQREQNVKIGHDLSNQLVQNANQYKSKENPVDGGHSSISSTSENVSRSKQDSGSDKPGNDGEKKRDSSSSSNVQLPPNQQADALQNASKHRRMSRKSSSRTEGNNTTSAIGKLTNRLNFLKERRTQIASELDKFRNQQQAEQSAASESSERRQGKSSEKSGDREKDHKSSKKTEAHPPNLDRGMSESFQANEKAPSKSTPRTFSSSR